MIKTSSLGDIYRFQGMLEYFHRPEITFDWVVEKPFAELPHLLPNVKSITTDVRQWRKSLSSNNSKRIQILYSRIKRALLRPYN